MTSHPEALERDYAEQLADTICRHGMRAPALLLLEAGQPFAFLAAQLVWVAQPALGLLTSRSSIVQIAELLERPARVKALVTALSSRSDE